MTLKNHARIFAQRPAKASFFGANFARERGCGGRAARQDKTDARRLATQS
jgi:hypothetical protein